MENWLGVQVVTVTTYFLQCVFTTLLQVGRICTSECWGMSRFRWSPLKLVPLDCPPMRSCDVSGPPGPKMIVTFGPPCATLGPPSQPRTGRAHIWGYWSKQNQLVKVNCIQRKVANEMSLGWLKCDKRGVMSSIYSKSHYATSIRLRFNRRTFYFNTDHHERRPSLQDARRQPSSQEQQLSSQDAKRQLSSKKKQSSSQDARKQPSS